MECHWISTTVYFWSTCLWSRFIRPPLRPLALWVRKRTRVHTVFLTTTSTIMIHSNSLLIGPFCFMANELQIKLMSATNEQTLSHITCGSMWTFFPLGWTFSRNTSIWTVFSWNKRERQSPPDFDSLIQVQMSSIHLARLLDLLKEKLRRGNLLRAKLDLLKALSKKNSCEEICFVRFSNHFQKRYFVESTRGQPDYHRFQLNRNLHSKKFFERKDKEIKN